MPLAIGLGMTIITLLFVLVNVSYSVVLSVAEIQQSDAVAMVGSRMKQKNEVVDC